MHSPLTTVIGARGYTREVSTPRARSVWIRRVKVPDQDDKQHDHQRKSGQSETPRNEGVSPAWGDDRVKDHADQEAHQKPPKCAKLSTSGMEFKHMYGIVLRETYMG
jgi:hypothetical protein